jgi:hypothetical protein
LPGQATVSTSGRSVVPAGGYPHVKPVIRILRKATIEGLEKSVFLNARNILNILFPVTSQAPLLFVQYFI